MKIIKKIILKIKEDFLAYLLLIFGFFARLLYIFTLTTPKQYLFSDPGAYDDRALHMAKGIYIAYSTYWPPFFHMFLSLIYRPLIWLGIENWRVEIDVVIFAFFYILGFWCIYQITKTLFTKKFALITLAILIFWWPFLIFNCTIMSENLFFVLVFLGLYVLIVKPMKPATGLWLGLFWGLAFITRPIFALSLPLFVIWGLYYKLDKKVLIGFITMTVIIVFSMIAFNFYYTNGAEKSFSSNGGIGFAALWCDVKSIRFNSPTGYFWFGWPGNLDYPETKTIITSVPFENQGYYYKIGLNCLKENPGTIFTNISSIMKLFHSHIFPDVGNIPYWQSLRLFFKILTGLLFILAAETIIGLLVGWIKMDETIKKYLYLFGLIISSLLITVYLQNPGEERYIIPYVPLLIILSAPILFDKDLIKKDKN
jgi:hypothetical protein